jgi:hypothetical protein
MGRRDRDPAQATLPMALSSCCCAASFSFGLSEKEEYRALRV